MTDSDASTVVRDLCLRYLARREYSRQELRQRLQAKGVSAQVAARVLDQLAAVGQQSDRRYADSLVRQRVAQGYGVHRIRAELRLRGIDDDWVDFSGYDWNVVLEKAYRRKYGTRLPVSHEETAARYRHLARRGFSSEQITRLLRQCNGASGAFD